jgi:hypothetical protein
MPERTVGRHRDTIFLTPRKDRMFNGSLLQAVEHLIASTHYVFVDGSQILEIKHVEVADAPGQYLALTLQGLECRHGLLKRIGAASMQQVTVDVISLSLDSDRSQAAKVPACVAFCGRILVTTKAWSRRPAIGFGYDRLRFAIAIHLRRIDVVHAQLQPSSQRGNCGLSASLLNIPGPCPTTDTW